uniref:Uncharacterized protein n=1 Tax=Arundo donax TaxID=35708 RepID=A0A0A9FYM1_ARUDO
MKDGNVEEALQAFGNYKRLHGLPEPRVLNSVIVSLTYRSSRRWLQRYLTWFSQFIKLTAIFSTVARS